MRNIEPYVPNHWQITPVSDKANGHRGIIVGSLLLRQSKLLFWGNIRPTWRNLSRTEFVQSFEL